MYTALKRLRALAHEANTRRTVLSTAPTMLLPPEQHFLYLLARDYYTGEGDIFDGGICLGGCTSCFAQGLAERDGLPERKLLHAYDQALVTVPPFFAELGIVRKQGESTLDLIEANIAAMPCRDRIAFHHGDILSQTHPESIEIMFLDVCKTQALNLGMQKLFSRLIPDKSVLVQQDYTHPWNPYIHATMGHLDEYFEVVGPVWFGSMVYLLKKAIPADVLEYDAYANETPDTLRKYIMMQGPGLLHAAQLTELHLAYAVMLFHKGAYNACLQHLKWIQTKECITGELEAVTAHLCDKINALAAQRPRATH